MVRKIIPSSGKFPISNAISSNDKYTMEISGQIGMNFDLGKLEDGIENQTMRALENVKKILEGIGWSLKNVNKVRIFLIDLKDYVILNNVYSKYFVGDYPARTVVGVKELPAGSLVEIDCSASGDELKNSKI